MSSDVEALFQAFSATIGKPAMSDAEFGEIFRQMMAAIVRFDYIVVFAYRGQERPIDLYSTFDPKEHIIFVTLYQAGPYLLDPFYQTARERRTGVFRMRELAPDRFFSSEYYRTYYVQTGLAEEIGFFIEQGDGMTVVLSLMRREATGIFPASEIALLKKAEPLVRKMTQHYLSGLAGRFNEQVSSGARSKRDLGKRPPDIQPTEAVWQNLKLTSRETAIVDLVLQGHSSESIGLKLDISTGTVKVHRRNVYRKLGISSQTQLLALYLKAFGRLSEAE